MATKKTQPKTTAAKKKAPVKRKAPAADKKASSKGRTASKKPARVVAKAQNGKDNFKSIQETAYLLAEKDNFKKDPTSYWLEAQKQLGAA